MSRRILLFVGVNFLIMMTMGVLFAVLNVRPYITAYGMDYWHLAIFCGIYGMGGAFISLAISRWIAKLVYGVELVTKLSADPKQKMLVDLVYEMARKAKLPEMPEVGVYQSPDINAFATGPTKSRALVAVSSGLLEKMNANELAGVIGHEVSHIANDDMVTMTLLQGVVNAFVMFMSRAIAYAVTIAQDDESGFKSRMAYVLCRFVFEVVFMLLGSILVCWYSRKREYRADAGGAELAGRENMYAALQFLRIHDSPEEQALKRGQPLQAMMISGADHGILSLLYSTHPPLDERINRLYTADGGQVPAGLGDLPTRDASASRSSNSLRDRMGKNDKI